MGPQAALAGTTSRFGDEMTGWDEADMEDEGVLHRIAPPVALDPVDTAAVVERYQQMVYAICLTHTRCRGDADDAFQEVFLTYHRKQPVCNDEEHRKAWLIRTTLTVTRRVVTDSWRTRVVPLREGETGLIEPDAFRFDDPAHEDLFRALAELPEAYRSVIHLFYFEDLPVGRIATLLDLEPGAVKMRLSRGRNRLREAMTKENTNA